MRNVVIVTRKYYPDISPVSAVFDKYIQQMKGEYMFHVIAVPTRLKYEPLDDPFVKVYYIQNKKYELRLLCEDRYKKNPTFFNKMLIYLFRIRTAILSYFVDDFITKWEEMASYEMLGKIYQEIKFDAVISLSGVITHTHLAAKQFKDNYPDVRWITLFTDPITYRNANFYPLFFNVEKIKKKQYVKELNIYDSADYNILIDNLYKDALEKFNQPKEKTVYFNYVLDDIRNHVQRTRMPLCDNVRLIYAGSLYKKIRNPEYMLSILSRVDNISLDIYVRLHECVDIVHRYVSDKIKLFPEANTLRYKEMICFEYDILVNIGNNCANQTPSKMLEYLSTGRPIINFYYNRDSQYDMIEKYPLGLNVGRDDSEAVWKVQRFCSEMKGKLLDYHEVEALYPDCVIDKQVEIIRSLINS